MSLTLDTGVLDLCRHEDNIAKKGCGGDFSELFYITFQNVLQSSLSTEENWAVLWLCIIYQVESVIVSIVGVGAPSAFASLLSL